jgi:thymidylate kinase
MNSKFLNTFFQYLNNFNLKYSVLRNYESLPESLNGSDLDILIDKNDVKEFYKLLDVILKETNGKIITKYGELTPRVCIAGYFENEYYGLQLDVHEGILPYKIYDMFPTELIIKQSKLYNNIYVTDTDDANILAFLKEVLNNQTCKEKYFKEASVSWKKNLNYIKKLNSIYHEEFLSLLDKILNESYSKETLTKLSILGRKSIINSFERKINVFKSSIFRYNRFFKTPGFTIAFLGTDGSGKSTIIDNITPPLNEAMHNSFYYEHMRPNLIPNIAQLFGKKKEDIVTTNPHNSKPSGKIGSIIRLFYYTFDYTVGYFLNVYKMNVKKSSIWIFDRYYYDYLIDQKRARINLPKWIIKTISFFIPKPDLIICLGTNPKKIYERKPELDLVEIERQINELKLLSNKLKNAHWVDTGNSIEESTEEVFKLIIETMAKRYKN